MTHQPILVLVTVLAVVMFNAVPANCFPSCSTLQCSPSLCCQDTQTGPACYSNTQYTCVTSGSTKRMCPKGNSVCGTTCFDSTQYTCSAGQLQQKSVTPTAAATVKPTTAATVKPTTAATVKPTTAATVKPTTAATVKPTNAATVTPTNAATVTPAATTIVPTNAATTQQPTQATTVAPTQQATTVAPTTAPPATSTPTNSGACAVCGSQACCNDSVNGISCYNPSQYSCPSFNGTKYRLCPLGNGACNGNCYQKNKYICTASGNLQLYSAPGLPGIPTNPTVAPGASTSDASASTGSAASSTTGSATTSVASTLGASTSGVASTTGSTSTASAATTGSATTGSVATTGSASTSGSVTTGSATTGSSASNSNGLFTPLQAFCVGACQSPVAQGFPSGTNAIPRNSPDGVGQWPVPKACNGGWAYGVPPRATWWDNYSGQAALPTNMWFVPYYSNPPNGVNAQGLTWPVYAMPYTTQATATGFLMGIPTASFIQSEPGLFDGSPPPVLMYGTTTLQFTFRTTSTFQPGKKIIDFDRDGTGITLQFTTLASQTMTVPVMRGSPFITAIYSSGATPAFDYTIGDIGFVNGVNTNNQLTSVIAPVAAGPLFVWDITIVQGTATAYKFRLYSSQNIPITVTKPTPQGCIVAPWSIVFNSPCVGTCTLRLAAYLSNYQDPVNPAAFYTGKLTVPTAVLDAAANVYPLVNSSNANRTVQFYNGGATSFNQYMYWNTGCMVASDSSCNPANLLMLALPHHLDLLPASNIMSSTTYPTQNGIAYGILGNSWTLTFYVPDVVGSTLTNDPFQFQDSITDPTQRAAILATLPNDMNSLTGPVHYSTFDGADCYSFGKYIAAVARLTLIADSLNQPSIAAQGRTFMRQRLDSWFNLNSSPYPFRTADELTYDTTWGGIIPATAIQTPGGLWSDVSAQPEFGSGGYNDHMFHYGYFLYAVAVTLKSGSAVDIAWFQNDFNHIMALARDIANPDPVADTYFTGFRHKNDWYVGHSWACGLFPTGDYPNVESTSEALNAWYALYLLGTTMANVPGLASFGANMQFVGKVLAVTDTQSFHYYSRMYPTPTGNRALVYPTQFTALGVIGNLWGGQAIFQTYFGFGTCEDMSAPLLPTYPPSCIQRHILTADQVRYYNSLMVFLIQAMPFTPFTNSLQNRTWLSQGFLAPALSFTNPDNSVSIGYTPEGKASFFPDFFGRCALNNGCDSWLAYAWQSDASMGPSNRVNAYNELNQYGSVPAGTTMTNILFHIASQPQV